MKKLNFLFLILAVLLTFGCGGDDPSPDAQNRSCQLTRQVSPNTTSDFIYNSAGKVIRVNNVRQDPTANFHMEITYNASGNIAEVKHFDYKNVQDLLQVYSYSSQNLPDTIYTMHNSQVGNINTYEYNASGQLIKWSSLASPGGAPYSYTTITYPAFNQSKEMVYAQNSTGSMVLTATHEKQYDDKKHPHAQLNFLFEPLLLPSNLLTVNSTYHTQGTTLNYTYTYAYNPEGYPTQQTITYSQPSMQPNTHTFSYNCQ